MGHLSRAELARYGIGAAIFDKLREARPTSIAWLVLAQVEGVLPELPGLLCAGVGDDLRMLRLAGGSIRAVAAEVLGELSPEDRARAWVAWRVIELAERGAP